MERIIIVGSGLVGTLLALYMARLGHRVSVYDRRDDPRSTTESAGKSINLTLCERGFRALDRVGVGDAVRRFTIPAYGREMHSAGNGTTFQAYGNHGEAIHSIARSDINRTLVQQAARHPAIRFEFNHECRDVDCDRPAVCLRSVATGEESRVEADRIFGCDGAFSTVRRRLQRRDLLDYSQSFVPQGYKELRLPAGAGGDWALNRNAIHIWPRGGYMLIGFANLDGSFTLALHLPFEGEPSFASIRSGDDLRALFRRDFPDVLPLLRDLEHDFFAHPVSSMVTIRCSPWTVDGKVALIGDAAHAIVPSYGQGANCGFEDCSVLHDCLESSGGGWEAALAEFEGRRKAEAEAIADLALEHFEELQERLGDAEFLLRKRIELRIAELHPDRYASLYSMISFTGLSYVEARRKDLEQRAIVDRILATPDIERALEAGQADQRIHRAFAAGAGPPRQLEASNKVSEVTVERSGGTRQQWDTTPIGHGSTGTSGAGPHHRSARLR